MLMDFRIANLSLLLILAISLVACSSAPSPTPQPVFTQQAVTNNPVHNSGGVTASGVVVPVREAQLSFSQSGRVQEVQVTEGDEVEAGQILAVLEGRERLEAAVVAAETEVLAAQQSLDAMYEDLEIARAQAYQAVVDASEAVGEAKRFLYYFDVPAKMADLSALEGLEVAAIKLDQAREEFEPYKYKPEWVWELRKVTDRREEDLKDHLDWAQGEYNTASRRLELEVALITAQANLEKALQDFETLQNGPDPDNVAIAEAHLENAKAGLSVARAALDQLTLLAPIDGTAVMVNLYASETVLPGQVVIILGDLSDLRVETSDLSERDIAEVTLGQSANVYVEALAMDIGGQVVTIAPQAKTLGGDVVYTVGIKLDEQPAGLRWGMSAEVEIKTE